MESVKIKYSPEIGEEVTEYRARLATITNPHPEAIKAAQIVSLAMELGLDKDTGDVSEAIGKIAEALDKFGATQSLSGTSDRLMQAAVEGFNKISGRNLQPKDARSLIAAKAEQDVAADLAKAVTAAWAQIKQGSGFGANDNNKKVVKSYMDNSGTKPAHTPLSRLAQAVLDLRESMQKARNL